MTQEKDVVLIHFEDNPMVYARVEKISPDVKPGWFCIKLMMLQSPVQVVNWILRDVYINGDEFTMNGNRMRLEKIICPEDPDFDVEDMDEDEDEERPTPAPSKTGNKVISLADRLKKQ